MAKGMGTTIAQNKKASHDYFIEETFEAGMMLVGTEIKSIRAGKVNLRDSFVRIERNEAFVHNMHIAHYEQGNQFNHEPLRTRKLLLHKRQIAQLIGINKVGGYSLIPLKIYIKDGYAKMLFGVAKGKRNYDKRQDLKSKDANRQIERALKERSRD
ncbi:MAG: SsrA-binding protein SmpB [Turicibacter sp.]